MFGLTMDSLQFSKTQLFEEKKITVFTWDGSVDSGFDSQVSEQLKRHVTFQRLHKAAANSALPGIQVISRKVVIHTMIRQSSTVSYSM